MQQPNCCENQKRKRDGENVDTRRSHSAPQDAERAQERPRFVMLHRFPHLSGLFRVSSRSRPFFRRKRVTSRTAEQGLKTSLCRFRLQVFLEKLFHRLVKREFILFVAEAVAFVVLDQVFHVDAALLEPFDDLI